ncbi:MAG: hypothetical protein AAF975_04720, partial [Spirochaetota bacterium]
MRRTLAVLVLALSTFPFVSRPTATIAAQVSTGRRNNPVVEKNNYIIRFSPHTGSYSLYKREVGKNRLVRLLNDREPRSTYAAIALNGRVYTLGRSRRYLANKSERLTLLADGGAIAWRLPQRINVKYYVRILSESSLTSYVRLNIIVENTSTVTQSVGMFHMFDIANNNLGLPAFSLPDGDVFRETILEARQVPYFVQTSYNAYFYLDVRGSTRPDRVILANWTKLHEAGWNYGFQLTGQGFGYNLYDSNNPAMGVYYDARPLMARQSRSYILYLAFDAVPSFVNLREFDDAQVLDYRADEPIVIEEPPQPEPEPVVETKIIEKVPVEKPQPTNELLERQAEPVVYIEPPRIRLVPQIDIESLYLLYHSENKRFVQLRTLAGNLKVTQKLQQVKLQQISPYRTFASPEEDLQNWRV